MKTFWLIEGIDVHLLNPDSQAAMIKNAYVGQKFKLDGKEVRIVSNTGLAFECEYVKVSLKEKLYKFLGLK